VPELEGVDVERQRVEFALRKVVTQRAPHTCLERVVFIEDSLRTFH
jgi:hypothetical protein